MFTYTHTPTEFTDYRDDELIARVDRLVIRIGVPKRLMGFNYLCRAIELVYLEPSAICNVVNGLYRRIADENGTSASCVERDSRTAIAAAWKRCEPEKRSEYFNCSKRIPKTREFIALIADELRRNLIPGGGV